MAAIVARRAAAVRRGQRRRSGSAGRPAARAPGQAPVVACQRLQGSLAARIGVDAEAMIDELDALDAEVGPAAAQVEVRHREVHVDGAGTRLEGPQAGIDGGVERAARGVAGGAAWKAAAARSSSSAARASLAVGDEALQLARGASSVTADLPWPARSMASSSAARWARACASARGHQPRAQPPCRAWRPCHRARARGLRRRPRWPRAAGASGGTRSPSTRTAATALGKPSGFLVVGDGLPRTAPGDRQMATPQRFPVAIGAWSIMADQGSRIEPAPRRSRRWSGASVADRPRVARQRDAPSAW